MFSNLSDFTKAFAFCAVAFGLMTIAALLYPMIGSSVILFAMFTPCAAALLMLLVVTSDGRTRRSWASLGLHRPGFAGWAPAFLIPLLVLGSAYGAIWASGLADYAPVPELTSVSAWLAPVLFVFAVASHLLTGALGEELGWRGYLLPHLVPAIGRRWGIVLTGVLHGLWHMPIIFLTPLYHADGNLFIIIPLFMVGVVAIGAIEGSLRLDTGSVWPAAIMHSTHNVTWDLLRTATVTSSPLVTEYLAGESGILPVTGYVIAAAATLAIARRIQSRRGSKPPEAPRLGA